MSDNRKNWQPLLNQLQQHTAFAQAMGGEEKIAQQHDKGRLTARERIAALCDGNSFNEYGALAGSCHPGGEPPLAGDALVGGTGRIDGKTVVVIAEDFTVKGGSIGHANAAKRARLVRLAREQLLPLVLMLDGAGERVTNSLQRHGYSPNDMQEMAALSRKVPTVVAVMGASAGHGAITALLADIVIMTKAGCIFSAALIPLAAALK